MAGHFRAQEPTQWPRHRGLRVPTDCDHRFLMFINAPIDIFFNVFNVGSVAALVRAGVLAIES
jgi:hypothetical protein